MELKKEIGIKMNFHVLFSYLFDLTGYAFLLVLQEIAHKLVEVYPENPVI